jgi:hypothetical protein
VAPAGKVEFAVWYPCIAKPICLKLFWHFILAAASRTFCTAGKRRPIKIAIIAITTRSSMRVKAREHLFDMIKFSQKEEYLTKGMYHEIKLVY